MIDIDPDTRMLILTERVDTAGGTFPYISVLHVCPMMASHNCQTVLIALSKKYTIIGWIYGQLTLDFAIQLLCNKISLFWRQCVTIQVYLNHLNSFLPNSI